MQRRRLPQLAFAAAAVLALGVAYGVARLKRYVDTDPGLCAQCHRSTPEFALWLKGSHRTVACQRCHHSTPQEGLAMLRAFLAGKSPDSATGHGKVEVGACAACHLSHDPRWPQIEGSRGHRIHVAKAKIDCVRCHAASVHGFEPVVASCKGCHGEHLVRVGGMEKLHCFACHNFLSSDPGLRPTRRDCLRCHRAEGVLPARFAEDAPMQFDCGACHKPHARSTAEGLVGCETCHQQMPRAGLHAARGHATCTDCHAAHLWRTERKGCLRCHGSAPQHAGGQACGACHHFTGAGQALAPRRPAE
ncbi:MAG TPA: hypothetical protein VM683_13445 [Anaeromyxobacteraceae bacterium]|nr:hypothetical protein [Anaeromyxobacteraceae bacterium]